MHGKYNVSITNLRNNKHYIRTKIHILEIDCMNTIIKNLGFLSKDELHTEFREAFLYVNNLGWTISYLRFNSEEKYMCPLMALYCYHDKITNIDKIGKTLLSEDLTRMFLADIHSIMHLVVVIQGTIRGLIFEKGDIFRAFWKELGVRMGKDPLVAKCIYMKEFVSYEPETHCTVMQSIKKILKL
jgi:hypothetical protein